MDDERPIEPGDDPDIVIDAAGNVIIGMPTATAAGEAPPVAGGTGADEEDGD